MHRSKKPHWIAQALKMICLYLPVFHLKISLVRLRYPFRHSASGDFLQFESFVLLRIRNSSLFGSRRRREVISVDNDDIAVQFEIAGLVYIPDTQRIL